MTLDEAIAHADSVGHENADCACSQDHIQLAEWLRELKTLRVKMELAEEIIEDIGDYECNRIEDGNGDPCPELMTEDEEDLLFEDPDDWCPFCRARLWLESRNASATD